jgi:hypothetical protein
VRIDPADGTTNAEADAFASGVDEADAVPRGLGCGYLLHGLPEPRCPECGRRFDPADVMTMDVPARRERVWRRRLLARVPILVWAITCFCISKLVAWALDAQTLDSSPLLLVVPGVLLAGRMRAWVRRRILASDVDPDARSERRFRWAGYLFAAVVVLPKCGCDVCPHAQYYQVGPIGVACNHPGDPNGSGPCGNHATWSRHIAGRWYAYQE